MEKEEIILKLKSFFESRSLQYNIDMVFLYGSWAGGYPRKDSDVDLAIVFYPEIEDEQDAFSIITDISYYLEAVLYREVNIVTIFSDFRHPMLYYNAIVLGFSIFIKDQNRFLSLKLEAIYQMEDFQIFGIPWQYQIAKKLIGR